MCDILEAIIIASDKVESAHIRQAIKERLILHKQSYRQIEHGYNTLTVSKQDLDVLKVFLHGWSVLYNSDLALAGITNRLTMVLHEQPTGKAESHILDAIIQLNSSMDDARNGSMTNHRLFRTMANTVCAGESWAQPDALCAAVHEFKAWRDAICVVAKDIELGLMAELVHMVHMQGLFQAIIDKLGDWLQAHYGWEEGQVQESLAWINHQLTTIIPLHLVNLQTAINSYGAASGKTWNVDMFHEVFDAYSGHQAAIVNALTQRMAISEAA
ncbi:hypothetical protein [Kordiimonas laminariae]|uniref:hypothetical protein n=1 Tax=Kordiimonas laminariae TaxID=2917717 RepID=UPI001FF142F3|nr:hypothetical protein [Kordiimonas laminariae]MCK0070773.1 hypothetical protein [Kordiimonas laminariae]